RGALSSPPPFRAGTEGSQKEPGSSLQKEPGVFITEGARGLHCGRSPGSSLRKEPGVFRPRDRSFVLRRDPQREHGAALWAIGSREGGLVQARQVSRDRQAQTRAARVA